jgi:phage terminase large subunit-like protein
MALFIRGAIEEGTPIWPERFSLDTLAQMRLDMGEYNFSCLMMNNPRNLDVQDLNVEDLRYWRWADDATKVVLYDRNAEIVREHELDELDICVAVDPAPAEVANSDRNAVVTVGTTKWGDVVVLDTWAKRCSPLEVIEYLFHLRRRFRPRVYGIENVAYQKVLKHFLKAEANRRGEYFNTVELKPGGKHKQHIRGLQPVAATGHLYILPTQHMLRSELADFPLGEFDDVADALALSMQMWRGVVSPARWLKYKESEKAILRRQMEDAKQAGIGHPNNLRQQLVATVRQGDPRYAPHEDDYEEPGWRGAIVLTDAPGIRGIQS